jgi:hypothetical protein
MIDKEKKVIGILQPGYLPWLGFFEQMYRSDIFVIYDDVQFDKGSWRNRNRIKSANGVQWLTVPVRLEFNEHPKVNEILIDNTSNWRKKHLLSIMQNFAKAPYLSKYRPVFEEAFSRDWARLIDLDMFFIRHLSEALGISRQIVYSSTLGISGDRIERLINICKCFHANVFYEGAAGKDYIDPVMFSAHGISIVFQNYIHPTYDQVHGEFVPYLSVIDLLLNHGDDSLKILISQQNNGENT